MSLAHDDELIGKRPSAAPGEEGPIGRPGLLERLFANPVARQTVLRLSDALIAGGCYVAAFALRFDFSLPADYVPIMLATMPALVACGVLAFEVCGVYRVWHARFGALDAIRLGRAIVLGSVLAAIAVYFLSGFVGYPRSVLPIEGAAALLASGFLRYQLRHRGEQARGKRTLIVGAGTAGASLAHQLSSERGHYPRAHQRLGPLVRHEGDFDPPRVLQP